MTDATTEEERLAAAWLEERGYLPERPTWLPKERRNPDFWAAPAIAENLEPLWCEVKSIDPDDSTLALHNFSKFVTATPIPPGLTGSATLNIEPHAIEQSVRWALDMFGKLAARYAGQQINLAFVQQTKGGTDITRVEIGGDNPAIVWVRGAGKEALRPPLRICDDYHAPATLIRDGIERAGEVYQFFDWSVPSQCALVVRLDRDKPPLTRIHSMSGGADQTRDRAASAIEDANRQIKAACDVRPAAAIVFLVPHSAFAEPLMVQAAVYGDLTVPIRLGEDPGASQDGDAYHGRNGVFRPTKNRHVSAAILYCRASFPTTFFQNPFAHRPIEDASPVFRGAAPARVNFA